MSKLDKRVNQSKLTSLGFKQGSLRGWTYTIRSESELPDLLDQMILVFQTMDKNSDQEITKNLKLSKGTELEGNFVRKKTSFLGLFSPSSHNDFVQMFNGAVLLKSAGFPVVVPFGILKRGGFLQPLEHAIIYKVDNNYAPLKQYVRLIEGSPAVECRQIWRSMGIELAKIHKAQGIAGVNDATRVMVNKEDPSDILFKVGRKFQAYPVLGYLRQAEDITGSNFVYGPTISPLDRLRFLTNYFETLGASDIQKKETLALVADMTRHKASKEWSVYQSDLPKKTTYLNLIRALDRYGQKE